MPALRIDGKAIADTLRADVAMQVEKLATRGIVPGLAVILVGDDPASQLYVNSKSRQTVQVGMRSFEYRFDETVTEYQLLAAVDALNQDHAVDGILVQLPLPSHIDVTKVLLAIDPDKDVDGFHPMNVGRIATGAGGIPPCTPLGAMMLLKSVCEDVSGLDAVVVGASNIVGKPIAQMLLAAGCTVSIAHSKTRNLTTLCRRADILVVAAGRPGLIRGSAVKPGAIIIDVGINRVQTGNGRMHVVGDVAYQEAAGVASAITPVPGGVGPMTIACLLRNTISAAAARRGIPIESISLAA